MTSFPFLDLPLELRREVYSHQLQLSSPLFAFEAHEQAKLDIPILRFSKQIYGEVLDMLKYQTTFHLRISWQGVTLNGLLLRDIKSHPTGLDDSDRIPKMRIQIYPPHPKQPMDMVHIWRHTQKLCNEFDRLSHLEHVSLEFIENEIGTWSGEDGFPHDTLRQGFGESDVDSILHLFSFLTNVSAATIYLPLSLVEDRGTQEMQQYTKASMTSKQPFCEDTKRLILSIVEGDIDTMEPTLKGITGANSRRMLKMFVSERHKLSTKQLSSIQQVWPYTECPKVEYPGDTEYSQSSDSEGENFAQY